MKKTLILTPDLLKKIGEEAPKSEAAKRKLEQANASIERSKAAFANMLSK